MKNSFLRLSRFLPPPMAITGKERLRASCGALIAIFLTGLLTSYALDSSTALPALVGPLGASAVLLFAVPSSPLAQPWSIIGGNVISAVIGVACAQSVSDPYIAGGLAVSGSIAVMSLLRCLHPPGGAIALTAVLGGPAIHAAGFGFALMPVAANSLLMLSVALLFNNATRHRYPHIALHVHANTHGTGDIPPGDRVGFTPADLDAVLKEYNEVLDVSRDDLETLLLQAEMRAYRRRLGDIRCADIMSHEVVSVTQDTPLAEAWNLLGRHKIKALPVLDQARHVVGIVTLQDFIRHAKLDGYQAFETRLRNLLNPNRILRSATPRTVERIMTRTVRTAGEGMHIVQLIPLLSDLGLHHLPVVDEQGCLAGIITQSDLIAALYRGQVIDVARAA